MCFAKSRRLGHASITATNRCGHLFDGLDTGLMDGLDAAHEKAASPPKNVSEPPKAAATD